MIKVFQFIVLLCGRYRGWSGGGDAGGGDQELGGAVADGADIHPGGHTPDRAPHWSVV